MSRPAAARGRVAWSGRVLLVTAALHAACTSTENRPMTDAERQAADAGAAFIARQYPDFDPSGKTLAVREDGGQWRVTYKLPPTMLGGAPVVLLDKATLAVVRSFRTQ